ncbi:glutaminase A [Deinococcus roseus]|uniref:Glutaminase n=1 Tax=Deinococcus roseus TaxID=392414 RepID=A0ABQ2DGQ7_9DEIO|nr:glutaminase A [Deinococcus roseus]GGJ56989.1 hypothetical protein GCM10008938_48920 [Deinococcus roseus]
MTETMTEPASANPDQTLTPEHLMHHLQHVYNILRHDAAGSLPDYIPELSQANPAHFALSVTLKSGQTLQVGDCEARFTLQSLSKPFGYALALQTCGQDAVEGVVNTEPSGDGFNSIRLDEGKFRPDNPMVNAGALAISSLLLERHGAHALQQLQNLFQQILGRDLPTDARVFTSENRTAHRNRAIVHLMHNLGMVQQDPEQILRLYLQQCALQVQVQDLSRLAATLALGGKIPGQTLQALPKGVVRQVLSVMFSCGMYNSAGEWACKVGLPAKSGVSGGLMAASPGKLGIAVYSPLLNAYGHSHRGVLACQMLARRLKLHLFQLEATP